MELKGNMRELESMIFGALVRAAKEDELRPEHLSPGEMLGGSGFAATRAGGGGSPPAKRSGRAGRTGLPTSPGASLHRLMQDSPWWSWPCSMSQDW